MGSVASLSPRGHYLAHEVGQLAGVSGDRIGQWARRGYIRSSQSTGRPRVYSYQDVAEAMVVHELVKRHVDLRTIKRTIRRLRNEMGTEWPLQHSQLYVPERASKKHETKTIVRREGDHRYMDLGANHPVLEDIDLQLIAVQLSRGGWAVRELPGLQHIEVNPNRLSGRPAVRGTRVSAEFAGRAGGTVRGARMLKRDYDLTDEQIRDARRWWETVQRYQEEDEFGAAS